MIALTICLSISSCSSVKRPDAYICGINSKSKELRCYNILKDFNDDGSMKPEAKPMIQPLSGLDQLNSSVMMFPKEFEKVKVWLQDLRDWSNNHCK
jgi:hypothetical protein